MIGPGGTAPPSVEDVDLLAATIVAEPVLILLPRTAVTQIGEDGTLVADDVFENALCAHGARPVTDTAFSSPPLPNWLVSIDTATAAVRITGPSDLGDLYVGSLPGVNSAWLGQVADNQQCGRGIVLITGFAAPTSDAALAMIAAGRASWVRARVELPTPN